LRLDRRISVLLSSATIYQVQLWDTEGLPFTIDNPEPVRVLCSEEVLDRNRYREEELTSYSIDHEWLWVTTLPKQVFPAPVIRQLGHSRCKNENNGWMDLTKHWAFKHGFLHACRHRPKQTTASGERESVSNHGLAAVTLILLIAFTLTSAFVLRDSKLARRDHLTPIAVAAQLRTWVSKTPPPFERPTERHGPLSSPLQMLPPLTFMPADRSRSSYSRLGKPLARQNRH
jgi:hypothetical protein